MTIAELIMVAWCLGVGLADLYVRRIPNILTLGACLVALSWLLVTGHSVLHADPHSVMMAAAISLLLALPAYAARVLGAADVKLLLAIALLGGEQHMLIAFVIAAILAVVVGISHFVSLKLSSRHMRFHRWIPFGTALSVGLLCAMKVAA